MKKFIILCIALYAQASFSATILRFAHAHPVSDSEHKAAVFFSDKVSEYTNGDLKISIYPNSQLGPDQTMIDLVRSGAIDIELSGNPYFSGLSPELSALDIPFLFSNKEEAHQILDGEIGKELLGKLEKNNLKGLAFWEIGFRNLTNNRRVIDNASDLKGLKLRTTPNKVHIAFFKSLGANPIPMPWSEVYSALETKTIDGQENPINLIKSANLNSVQKYLSLTAHAYTSAPLVMTLNKFNSLNNSQQQALILAAHEAAIFQRHLNDEQENDNLDQLIKSGMIVNRTPDRESLKMQSLQTINKLSVDQPFTPYLNRIRQSLHKD